MSSARGNRIGINGDRMLERIELLAGINREKDGACNRMALTDADREGRDCVVQWMHEAGLDVLVDVIGNIIGTMPGSESEAPVMTGSHIDTVATGGRYDGVYGVIGGLEALQTAKERGIRPKRPLCVGVFTNEEGVRFAPDMMGSLVFCGLLPVEEALASNSPEGVSVRDELARIGYLGREPCGHPRPHAFVELHIEQGPVLDAHAETIGVVSDLQGISWQEVRIDGISNHAGTTPMNLRHDAGYCAARTAVFVHDFAKASENGLVATVGSINLVPNLVNVIARQAVFTIDMRCADAVELEDAERRTTEFLKSLGSNEGVAIEIKRLVRTEPIRFDPQVVRLIEGLAIDLGQGTPRRMTSGAGHDAQMMAQICPTAMIFVPSVGGISHNPREYTEPQHLIKGAELLLQTLLHLAEQ